MISKLYLFETESVNPYHNLALEEYLLDTLPADGALLYLWQNHRTVVIGRNQSSENEVNVAELEKDGGYLVRRLSGGGAVFHDRGNLNFTIIVNEKDFDLAKQNQVIVNALAKSGLKAEVNGRNDLTINGCKFSGNAYYHTSKNSYHHGTIMLAVNRDDLARYLSVSKKKLAGKKVESVRSRVINLKDVDDTLTIVKLKQALKESFSEVYSQVAEELTEESFDSDKIAEKEKRFASAEWKYDRKRQYAFSREERFDWGTVIILYDVEDGIITDACIYTDALATDRLTGLPVKLKGRKITDRLLEVSENEEERDVISLLLGKE